MTWYQNMGHKGSVLRARCIGTETARTQLLLYTLHPLNLHQHIMKPAPMTRNATPATYSTVTVNNTKII